MLISKKEFEELKKKVEEQEQIINNMINHLVKLQQEVNELKKPKEPQYFG
ncbi:hypothetical protein [Anoxybacillus sp. UARK-01]|nr:hypothetical protein [Anoxybacillus sp. UARK-01]